MPVPADGRCEAACCDAAFVRVEVRFFFVIPYSKIRCFYYYCPRSYPTCDVCFTKIATPCSELLQPRSFFVQ